MNLFLNAVESKTNFQPSPTGESCRVIDEPSSCILPRHVLACLVPNWRRHDVPLSHLVPLPTCYDMKLHPNHLCPCEHGKPPDVVSSEPTCRHMARVRVCVSVGRGEFLSFGTFPPNEIIFTSLQCHGIISSLSKRHVTWEGGWWRHLLQREQIRQHRGFVSSAYTHTHTHTRTGEEYYSLWQVYHAPPRPTGPCYSELCAPCPV